MLLTALSPFFSLDTEILICTYSLWYGKGTVRGEFLHKTARDHFPQSRVSWKIGT